MTSWQAKFDTINFGSSVNWDNPNFFLNKYDKNGNILWSRVGGGDGNDLIQGLDVDGAGNIYTWGMLQSSGNPAYIYSPAKDTVINSACAFFFAKWDTGGNLTYIKTYPTIGGWSNNNGMFKRLKNGLFLTVLTRGTGSSNIGTYPLIPNSRNFILLDSLGEVVKGAVIDTLTSAQGVLCKFVTDENDNIYFPFANGYQTSISILSHSYTGVNTLGSFLFKTDTSFTIKAANLNGYNQGATSNLTYSNGSLYGSGRNAGTSYFEWDTVPGSSSQLKYTAYKIDTNLHLVWVSRPTVQPANPTWDEIYCGASKDNLYLGYQHRGTVTWDSASLTTPANTYKMAVLKLRTCDGVCVKGEFARGQTTSKDLFESIKTDTAGNGYFMGTYTGSIGTPTDSTVALGGTSSPDMFILKWGTPNNSPIPTAPVNVLATATGTNSVLLSWQNTTGIRKGFRIFRSPNGTTGWAAIDTTASTVYTYTDNTVLPHTAYWYKVTCYATCGESPYSVTDSALTWAGTCPATVTAGSATTFCAGGSVTLTAPAGYSYLWSNSGTGVSITVTQSGTYTVTVTDNSTCTTTSAPLTVTVLPNATGSFNAAICNGSSYTFNGQNLTATGNYNDTLQAANGCDSVITLHLTVNNATGSALTVGICSGNSYLFNGQNLTTGGVYKDTLTNSNNCDSIITLNLTVNSVITSSFNAAICTGSTYFYNGQNLSVAGNYNDTLTAQGNCDSIVTLHLAVNTANGSAYSASVCSGNSYSFNGQSLTTGGVYKDTLTNINGCDSIITLTLSINSLPNPTLTLADSICSNAAAFALTGSPAGGTYTGTGVAGGMFTPSTTGANIITYTYTDGNTCINSISDTIIVYTCPDTNCHALYTLYPDTVTAHNWWALNQATGTGAITYTWYWGDGTNSTGAYPSHTYSTAGNYNICLSIADSAGCTDTYCDSSTYIYKTDAVITVNVVGQLPTGIAQIRNPNSAIRIYPNPASDQLNIQIDEALIGAQLNLYDVTGSLIQSTQLQTQHSAFNTQQFPSGVYIAEINPPAGRAGTKEASVKKRWVKM